MVWINLIKSELEIVRYDVLEFQRRYIHQFYGELPHKKLFWSFSYHGFILFIVQLKDNSKIEISIVIEVVEIKILIIQFNIFLPTLKFTKLFTFIVLKY